MDVPQAACPGWPSKPAADAVLMITPRWFEARGSFFAISSAACLAGHGEGGVEIHVDDVCELGQGVSNPVVVQHPGGPAAAGPVRADVGDHGGAQRPEAGGRLDRLGDGIFVHAIGRHVEGAEADLPGQRRAPFIGHIRDHDLGALLGEPAHGRGAEAASASHPSATAATVSNCAATNSAARRGRSAADGGVAPVPSGRTGWPTGTSGAPTRASSSAKSGGAHTRISAPSARNRTASPTIGSTSPRDSFVDNNTRISLLPFP